MAVQYLKPEGMHLNPAFTQALILPVGARTLLIGGQNAVDKDGQIVGKGDFGAQSAKAIDNLLLCLAAAGGSIENIVQMRLYIVGDVDIRPGFAAWMAKWGDRPNPPLVTGIRVLGLANPDYLVEIEAMAVLPS